MVLHIGQWMQFLAARIESVGIEDNLHTIELCLKMEKMLIYKPRRRGVLTYPEGPRLRSGWKY
ncbi:MAG: hypothetical protein MUO26_07750 [Methanotrichaceae archaeon]|nr:hypothetical protein [Methanotrichaceae archaeon]